MINIIYKCSLITNPRDLLEGIRVVTTLMDLYKVLPNEDMVELYILEDFTEKFFTSFSLSEFLEEFKIMHPNVIIHVNDKLIARKDELIERLRSVATVHEFLNLTTSNFAEVMPMLSEILEVYGNRTETELQYSQTVSSMYTEYSRLAGENMTLKRKVTGIEYAYKELLAAYDTLSSRIHYTYNKDTETNELFHLKIESHNFMRVLYIKEITRVTYVDTLIYYLKQVVNSLYSAPTRNIVIEAPYAYSKVRMYKGYKEHIALTYQDVASSDIFMAGFQHDLVRDIFLNPMGSLFLIVLDRSGWKEPFIECENMEVIYTVSDLEDLNVVVPKNKVISYSPETLHIPYIKDFDKLNTEQQLSKYSSFGTMRRLLSYLELDNQSNINEEEDEDE